MKGIANFSGKRVLVTGASGFIGERLCKYLRESEANIYAVSTKQQKKSGVIDEWLVGNLENASFTKSAVLKSRPEIIFHLAGYTSGHRGLDAIPPTIKSNLIATVNMLTAAAEIDIERLVLAGSMEEPESKNGHSIPVSPYAASKWASSGYAKMFYKLYGTPITIARIFMVYGPGPQDSDNLIPHVITHLIRQKEPRLTSGKRLVDWIYIDDVVEGLLQLAQAEKVEGKTIDMGSGKQFSIREVCKRIKTILESDIELTFGTLPDRPFERITVADLDATTELLGWEPKMEIDEGLEETISWFRQKLAEATG